MIFVYLDHPSTKEINVESISTTMNFESVIQGNTELQSYRRSRYYRRGYNKKPEDDVPDIMNDYNDHDDHGDMREISQPKVDYWAGYYDFLINEGSYKFWAFFQVIILATAAFLIYNGFSVLYYAKVNSRTTHEDYDDIFRRRRKKRYALPPSA